MNSDLKALKGQDTHEGVVSFVKNILGDDKKFLFQGIKGISLSEYGARIESTIHNNLHNRFAYYGYGRPSAADPLNKENWDKMWKDTFDSPNYDALGDSYSSHVHPWFYRLHGWVDARIDDWLRVNGYASVGTADECKGKAQPCYIWLSDKRYVAKGNDVPWAGPGLKAASSQEKESVMSLHAHHAPVTLSDDVIEFTKGLRAQNDSMNRQSISKEVDRDLVLGSQL